jgi:hypothetical protein
MVEHNQKLKEKALAAYEASDLKQQDVEKNKEAASRIKRFLSKIGIDEEVKSNLFEIDGIRFHAFPYEDEDGVYGYGIMASRQCTQCLVRIVLKFDDYEDDDEEGFSPAMFGQWLSKSHLCEFANEKEERKRIGYLPPPTAS